MRSVGKAEFTLVGLLVTLAFGSAVVIGDFRTVTPATAYPSTSKGNPEAHVWVDLQVGLYYCSDSPLYHRLSPGKEITQAEAKKQALRPALGIPCQ